jgi:hypothetical protein
MRSNYKWGWQINQEGFQALPADRLTREENDKRQYVDRFLAPSVEEAECGWYGITYCVCENARGDHR